MRRPATPGIYTAGQGNGFLWGLWTPSVTQSATPAQSSSNSLYLITDRVADAWCTVSFTGSGTASNSIVCTLPFTALWTAGAIGEFRYFDSGNTNRAGTVVLASTTTVNFIYDGFGSNMGAGDFAIASGDSFSMHVRVPLAA